MSIVIKKRVSLGFLGEEYAEGYLVLQAIPVSELDSIQKKALDLTEKAKSEDANAAKLSQEFLKQEIVSRLVEGKIPQGDTVVDITKDNINDLPVEVFIEAWEQMNGKLSPKA